jgi:hypothetical protein
MCYRFKVICGNPNCKPLGADPNDEGATHDPPYFCKLECEDRDCGNNIRIQIWAPISGPLCFDCMYGGYRSYYADQVALAADNKESLLHLATLPKPPVVDENKKWVSDGEFGRLYAIWDQLCQLFTAQTVAEHKKELGQQNQGAIKISSSRDQKTVFEYFTQEELKGEIRKAYNQQNISEASVSNRFFQENLSLFLSHKTDLDAAHQKIANNKSFDYMLKEVLAGGSKVEEICPSFLARKIVPAL